MKKMKRLIVVERGKGKGNFSCFATESVGNYVIAGYGSNSREELADAQVAINEYKDIAAERGEEIPDMEFDIKLDIGAFFDYFPLDVTATARYIGVNPSVLRQYVTGLREPRQVQIDKIREGIKKLATELEAGLMIDKPTVFYIK